MRRARLLLALLLLPVPVRAVVYDVGPGQAYAAVGDVPWESLGPGDEVRIHWRAAPYQEKLVIGVSGTESAPIVVRGVRGPGGERPVLDGRDATTRPELNFWSEVRGLIKIGGSNTPPDSTPEHIVIEGLELRSARAPFTFTGRDGLTAYSDNAAAVFIEKGRNIVIRDCVLRDSGNGLFIASSSEDVLIEGNHLYDNGVENSIYEHNSYTEARRITFQLNHYGPLRTGCLGNNLKDRSAGLVVRYNWIESGNRQLDLVDAGGSGQLWLDPDYGRTFVYGNVLVEHEGDGNRQMVHYGGDSGDTSRYRKGRLYFHHNTLVSTRNGRNTMLRLSTNDETADVRNNVVYTTSAGSELSLLSDNGVLDFSHNWLKPGWTVSFGTFTGTLNDDGTNLEGTDPGFADFAGRDYRPAAGSPLLDAAAALDATVTPEHDPAWHYLELLGREPRPADGTADLGAYERCTTVCGGTDGGTDAGAAADAGPGADGGTLSDAGAGADGGTLRDAGAGADGGTVSDAGPGADGGTVSDAGPGADGGTVSDAGAADGSGDALTGGGCDCSTGGRGAPASALLLALLAGVFRWSRRRR